MARPRVFLAAACLLVVVVIPSALSRPTLYQVNDNDKLEPVMVPVSSTVIPLPIYKVSSGVDFLDKDHKIHKPEEPIKLITAGKKKPVVKKGDDRSEIKEISL